MTDELGVASKRAAAREALALVAGRHDPRAGQRLHRRAVPGRARRAGRRRAPSHRRAHLEAGRRCWPATRHPTGRTLRRQRHRPGRGRRRRDRDRAASASSRGGAARSCARSWSRRQPSGLCIIADGSKLVTPPRRAVRRCRSRCVPFGWRQTAERIRQLGGEPTLRIGGRPAGHRRRPLHPGLRRSARSPTRPRLAAALKGTLGVVEHGMFSGWPGGPSWPVRTASPFWSRAGCGRDDAVGPAHDTAPVVGIDLGGTKIRAVVSPSATARSSARTSARPMPRPGQDVVVGRLVASAQAAIAASGVAAQRSSRSA